MSLTENRAAALTIEPMRPDDWAAVHRIYAEGIATGDAVYVASEARRRGIGRALLEALIPTSEAAGYWTLLAGVMLENTASLALHEAVGFQRVGVQHGMGQDAHGRWRDVVLLERRSPTVGR